jgi:hypothetical protein
VTPFDIVPLIYFCLLDGADDFDDYLFVSKVTEHCESVMAFARDCPHLSVATNENRAQARTVKEETRPRVQREIVVLPIDLGNPCLYVVSVDGYNTIPVCPVFQESKPLASSLLLIAAQNRSKVSDCRAYGWSRVRHSLQVIGRPA